LIYNSLTDIDRLLETYSLEEILEYNDILPQEVLNDYFGQSLKLPPTPVDANEKE